MKAFHFLLAGVVILGLVLAACKPDDGVAADKSGAGGGNVIPEARVSADPLPATPAPGNAATPPAPAPGTPPAATPAPASQQ